jgi:GNAT superfamily N-acetyltransferase
MRTTFTISHLEMTSPAQLRPGRASDLVVSRVEAPCPELNRFFYAAVGGDWYWVDLLGWSYDDWRRFVDRPVLHTWVGSVRHTPAGYFELEGQADGGVDILHFGLLPSFIGQGHGGHLLTEAVRQAWALEPTVVRLNTNTLDSPHALANYLARGFRIVRQDVVTKDLPDRPPGPWPGARSAPAGDAAPSPPPESSGQTGEAALNAVGVLRRREIEARVLAPFVEALAGRYDRAGVLDVLRGVIVTLAREQGRELASLVGDRSIDAFVRSLEWWTRDDALAITVREQSPDRLSFDVTRCRYAELYRALGIPELGATLSCNRDFALVEGFDETLELTRSQTIMQGAPFCDFRYARRQNPAETPDE